MFQCICGGGLPHEPHRDSEGPVLVFCNPVSCGSVCAAPDTCSPLRVMSCHFVSCNYGNSVTVGLCTANGTRVLEELIVVQHSWLSRLDACNW